MASLFVLGARQRNLLFREEAEWDLYEAALILKLDTKSGAVHTCVEYKTPPEARAGEYSSTVFKSGTLVGDVLYTCTSTEVLVFELPDFTRIGYVSLPCFNDLHHVAPASDGSWLAAVTGLDMVVKFTPEGEVLTGWTVLPEPLWSRFSQATDYRKVASTKPHKSHPNFVFELDGEIWVTRFQQCDAISLNGSGKRIEGIGERPHDGIIHGEHILFTAVDGKVVVVDRRSLRVSEIVDLRRIQDRDQ